MREIDLGNGTKELQPEWQDSTQTITVQSTNDFALFLSQNIGSVKSGTYSGTEIAFTGAEVVVYIKKEGNSVGIARIKLSELVWSGLLAWDGNRETNPS